MGGGASSFDVVTRLVDNLFDEYDSCKVKEPDQPVTASYIREYIGNRYQTSLTEETISKLLNCYENAHTDDKTLKRKEACDVVRNMCTPDAESVGNEDVVSAGESRGPYAVSLNFLLDFVATHPAINEDTKTAEVVYNIIIPETENEKSCYVDSHLVGKQPHYFTDLKPGCRKLFKDSVLTFADLYGLATQEISIPTKLQTLFLSHSWGMPFLKLVQIAKSAVLAGASPEDKANYAHDGGRKYLRIKGSTVFFWVDVFCKNQHVPSPAMDEFKTAMNLAGSVLVTMWPAHQPLALTRIWCLYEIFIALTFEIHPQLGFDMTDYISHTKEKRGALTFPVDLLKAQATVESDLTLILDLIRQSIGVDDMTTRIYSALESSAAAYRKSLQIEEEYNDASAMVSSATSCFDGESTVRMGDGSERCVKDIRVGDIVWSHYGFTSEVVLVTVDDVSGGYTEMCDIHGVLLTVDHPVLIDAGAVGKKEEGKDDLSDEKKWALPREVVTPRVCQIDKVYNFELAMGHTVLLNGMVPVMTLGHPGITPNSEGDKLYGKGWVKNPRRKEYMDMQQSTTVTSSNGSLTHQPSFTDIVVC